jgi:hypothetical protein
MWNTKKHLAMAVLGVGLAFAATPASAQCGFGYTGYPGAYGYGGGCGGYGSAGYPGAYGYGGGCSGYGYAPASYGYGGYGYGGCRSAAYHPHRYGGYALAYIPRHYRSSYAYAAYIPVPLSPTALRIRVQPAV